MYMTGTGNDQYRLALDCMFHSVVLYVFLIFMVDGLPNEVGVELIILMGN
jgi:hypothetical protein